jgi:LEA14-like dessication related protein
MMNLPKWMYPIVFIASPLLFGTACKSSLKEPDFIGARNFKIGKLGLQESYIGMDLYYFNPNGYTLKLKKADLEVYLENRYVGQTQLDTLLDIPAKDTFSIPVKLGIDMKNLFPNLLTLALKDDVELKMEGSAKLSRSGITMNIPVHYTGKHKIVF